MAGIEEVQTKIDTAVMLIIFLCFIAWNMMYFVRVWRHVRWRGRGPEARLKIDPRASTTVYAGDLTDDAVARSLK